MIHKRVCFQDRRYCVPYGCSRIYQLGQLNLFVRILSINIVLSAFCGKSNHIRSIYAVTFHANGATIYAEAITRSERDISHHAERTIIWFMKMHLWPNGDIICRNKAKLATWQCCVWFLLRNNNNSQLGNYICHNRLGVGVGFIYYELHLLCRCL